MSAIELSSSQEKILNALVNLNREIEGAVKGKDIAERVNRKPGTVRNKMQALKSLQLVESVPGPKGGYKPTTSAYEILDIQQIDEPAEVPLRYKGDPVDEANIMEIDLSSVHHPELCRAEIYLQGSSSNFHKGDEVTIGPTPLSKLVIDGIVDRKDVTSNSLVLRIEGMRTSTGTGSPKRRVK